MPQPRQSWFHLYRILVESDSPLTEVAPLVEQFAQARHRQRHAAAASAPAASCPIARGPTSISENLLQGSSLGEFAARLDLLEAFERQLGSMAASAVEAGDSGGSGNGNAASDASLAARAVRWRQLGALLFNVRRYYSQFAHAVAQAISTGMAEQEKHLQVRVFATLGTCTFALYQLTPHTC